MALYPNSLRSRFQIAALDLPVPDALTDSLDRAQWRAYTAYLSPGRLLKKMAQALDEFHDAIDGLDLKCALEDQRLKIYSKWEAAEMMAMHITTRLKFELPRGQQESLGSDIDETLFYITKFLEETGSPDLGAWKARMRRHADIEDAHPNLSQFVHEFYETRVRPALSAAGADSLRP